MANFVNIDGVNIEDQLLATQDSAGLLSAEDKIKIDNISETGADWNQNDETAFDYIKNRPFYEEIDDVVLLDNYMLEGTLPEIKHTFIVGDTYTVIYNGTVYDNLIVENWEDEYNGIGGIWGNHSTYPFDFYTSDIQNVLCTYMEESCTITLIHHKEIIYKIDEKYLPKSIGKNSTGEESEIFNDYSNNVASGDYSHAEGSNTTASGDYSHAEGYDTTASGNFSHSEGYKTVASGTYSHSEGYKTVASGLQSHAEGNNTTASGDYSHSAGTKTIASRLSQNVSGEYNVGEDAYDYSVTSVPNASFQSGSSVKVATSYTFNSATGVFTLKNYTTVNPSTKGIRVFAGMYFLSDPLSTSGKTMYCIPSSNVTGGINTSTKLVSLSGGTVLQTFESNSMSHTRGEYIHIAGNGTSDTDRSNAHTLDWNGVAWFKGDVYVGSTSGTNKDEGSKRLATIDDVPQLATINETIDFIREMGYAEPAMASENTIYTNGEDKIYTL